MSDVLKQLDEGLYTASVPVSILGMRLSSSMALLELPDSELLVYSPVHLTPELKRVVDARGVVTQIYVPNLYHHLYALEWSFAYPHATVHAPAGINRKQPELRVDRVHGVGGEPFSCPSLDEIPIQGFRLRESVLFHQPTGTLVVADLVHNIGRPSSLWTRIYAGAMGFYGRVGLSRMIARLGFSDRAAARESVDLVLSLPIRRIVVGHGSPIEENPIGQLTAALIGLR